jgi:hypothetical protein
MAASRLIAGLRITKQDEALLDVVRPFFPDADSAGELAYRLWRRGLELTLAELASVSVALPPDLTEEILATLVAPRLLLCLPLLRRTGMLALLVAEFAKLGAPLELTVSPLTADDIQVDAAVAIVGLGGNDFL